MMGRVSRLGGTQVRVGVLGDAAAQIHPVHGDLTVGMVALVNEFGSRDGHVPRRSFIASTFHDHPEEIGEMAARAASQVINQGTPAADALGLAGERCAELMQRQILDQSIPPPNRPSTVAQKGSDHPLLDTGLLVKSISHAVVNEIPLDGDDYESISVEETI